MLMPVRLKPVLTASSVDMRNAMRRFASSVCVIAVDGPQGRTGCAATSVSSLSVDPPVLMFTLMGGGSTARALHQGAAVGISLLTPAEQPVAQRFSGFNGETGKARFGSDPWQVRVGGALTHGDALVQMACTVDEILTRHGNLVVFARVHEVQLADKLQAPLLYCDGDYHGQPARLGAPHE